MRMGRGQSTHTTLTQCIFLLKPQMKCKPSLPGDLQRGQIYPKPTYSRLYMHTSCLRGWTEVLDKLWESSDETGYMKPTQNKHLWSINTDSHIPPLLSTEQRLPLQSVLQHVRHIDKANRSLFFFSALHSKAMFFVPTPLIFIPSFLLHLLPRAIGLSAVSSYWKQASLFGLKGQSQLVCSESFSDAKSLTIS